MRKIGHILVMAVAALLLLCSLTVAAETDTAWSDPTHFETVTDVTVTTAALSTEPTQTTETMPTVATSTSTQPSQPDGGEDTATQPFPIRGMVIYTLIALLIMVGGGLAIVIITRHHTNTPEKR